MVYVYASARNRPDDGRRMRVFLYATVVLSSFLTTCGEKTRLVIGSLLPIGENPLVYSTLLAPAVELAVAHVNAHPDILPNHQLELRLNDSKCNAGLAIYQMYRLLEGNNETCVAFLGAGCSSVTQPLAQASHLWNIPHFNFLSSSPALDDRSVYPRYYHLLPTENGLNPGRVALMKSIGWKNAIILVETSDLFNLNARNLEAEMRTADLNRPEIVALPDDDDFSNTVDIIKGSDVRVLFGLFYEDLGRYAICKLYQNGIKAPSYVWILPDWYHSSSWYLEGQSDLECTSDEMEEALNGYFAFDFAQLRPDHDIQLATGMNVSEVAVQFQNRTGVTSHHSALNAFQTYSAYGYDAVVAIAILFHNVDQELASSGEMHRLDHFSYEDDKLGDVIERVVGQRNVSFEGLTGRVEFYNLLSDDARTREAEGFINIKYYRQGDNSSCLVAQYNNKRKNLTLLTSIPWTTNDGEAPVDIRSHQLIYSHSGIFIALAVIGSLLVLATFILLLFNIHARKHWYLRKTIPRLNEIILLGCLQLYVGVILYGFDGQFFKFGDKSIACCYMRTIFLTIGLTCCFVSMLVKTITQLIAHFTRWRFKELLFVCGVLIFGASFIADGLLLLVWFAVDPWKRIDKEIKSEGRLIFVREQCNAETVWLAFLAGYKIIVLIVSIALTILRIRLIKKRKEDSPHSDIAAYSCGLFMALAAFGLVYIEDPGIEYAMVSSACFLMISFILLIVFSKKVYVVVSGKPDVSRVERRIVPSELTELDKAELKELRRKSREQTTIIKKLVLERPNGCDTTTTEDVKRVLGYLPGDTFSNMSSRSVYSTGYGSGSSCLEDSTKL